MRLTPHFTLEELYFSETAMRHGWDNAPPSAAIDNLTRLAVTVLEPVREAAGPLVVTSGYRCKRVNDAVGSSDRSAHRDGRAADIRALRNMRPLVLARVIDELDVAFDQLIHEFGAWVHVGIAPAGDPPRRQVLTIDRHGTRAGLLEIRP